MATHSRIPSRKTPQTGEPGRLQSMGLHRVGRNRVTERAHIKNCADFCFLDEQSKKNKTNQKIKPKKKKQIHRSREQTSSFQWGEGKEVGQVGIKNKLLSIK